MEQLLLSSIQLVLGRNAGLLLLDFPEIKNSKPGEAEDPYI